MCLKGFFQVKKIKKSEKNSEVGVWVKPKLGFVFFWQFGVFLCCYFAVHVPKKKHDYSTKNRKSDSVDSMFPKKFKKKWL